MTTFRNKIVLVTGGSGELGRLLAEKSLREGASAVVLWDINRDALEAAKKELQAMGNKNVHTFVVDVSDKDSIEGAATRVLLDIGNIDILFNNAGVVIGKLFKEHTAQDIDLTVDVNVSGVMHVARVFLPDMLRQGSGHIVNISSASAFIGNPKMSVYAGSKWAVLGWSESLRLELEQEPGKLRVTTICPSYIRTKMFAGAKAPLLFPLLEPEDITDKIMMAVKNDDTILMAPDNIPLVPIFRSVLPARVFDFFAERLGVYSSMKDFKGKEAKDKSRKIKVD